MVHTIQLALLIAFLLVGGTSDAAEDTALAWAALRGDGHIALIRHAPAPGATATWGSTNRREGPSEDGPSHPILQRGHSDLRLRTCASVSFAP